MRFNFTRTRRARRRAKVMCWHKWFAWRPVNINAHICDEWVWLELIARKRTYLDHRIHVYKELTELPKETS